MNYDVKPSVIQMEKETFKQLMAEVKETIAVIEPKSDKSSFGVVDIWNIRRNAKSASSMMKR
jgi:hypothetical protein